MNKWEKGPVKLANSEEAFINRFCEKRKRYIGEHTGRLGGVYAAEWNAAGEHTISGIGDPLLNLAPPPKKRVRVQACILVYEDGSAISTSSDESDLDEAKKHVFALVKFDHEVTEGEGL